MCFPFGSENDSLRKTILVRTSRSWASQGTRLSTSLTGLLLNGPLRLIGKRPEIPHVVVMALPCVFTRRVHGYRVDLESVGR